MLAAVRKLGLDEIVSKHAASPYRSGRQSLWVKTKCKLSDTFTVISFADDAGYRPRRAGSLYVGPWDGDLIQYAGKIQIVLALAQAAELRALYSAAAHPAEAADQLSTTPAQTVLVVGAVRGGKRTYTNVTAAGDAAAGMLSPQGSCPMILRSKGRARPMLRYDLTNEPRGWLAAALLAGNGCEADRPFRGLLPFELTRVVEKRGCSSTAGTTATSTR